jgi:hypothetical protein
MRRIVTALCLSLAVAGTASAADIAFTSGLAQGEFRSLVEDLGSALSYKNVAPASPLGFPGFEVAIEATGVDIGDTPYWNAAMGGDVPSMLPLPKLRARVGLPFDLDVGLSYAKAPSSNVQFLGAEASWALLAGSAATPALGIRATYTKLGGVDELDVQTAGLDASISKGFVFVTPYAGAGLLWTDGKAKGKLLTDPIFLAANGGKPLEAEQFWRARYFGGAKFTIIPLLGITGEVEYSGIMSYSLKLGVSF